MKKIFLLCVFLLLTLSFVRVSALSQTPAGSDFYYVGDTKECQVIDYYCDEGYDYFSDSAGCGCKKQVQKDTKICTMDYTPVCGTPNTTCPDGAVCMMPLPQTYGNLCQLEAEEATFLYKGECKNTSPKPDPKVCTMEYAPVCGQTPAKACMGPGCASEKKTFGNKCSLEAAGATYLYAGECQEDEDDELPEDTKTKHYVGDTKSCMMIKYRCDTGWDYFADNIGCGCEKKVISDSELSSPVQAKIELLIETFIRKLEAKNYTEEKNIEVIETIIVKMKELGTQTKYQKITAYAVILLEKYKQKYEDGFSQLEDILDF